jgi:hypothetical protein
MTRPSTQARAARKLRRDEAWIAADPAAAALAQQLVYLADAIDAEVAATGSIDVAKASTYLATHEALYRLKPAGA